MDGGDVTCFGASPIALVNETQEIADLIELEAEFARSQDEAKPPLVCAVIAAIAACRVLRHRS
jgi:hypothetical protein